MNLSTKEAVRMGARIRGAPKLAVAKLVKVRGQYDSKTEALYADHLELLRVSGEIVCWIHHPFTLHLEAGVKYTPDFLVLHRGGLIEIVEVKGYQRKQDVLRFKWAASKFDFWAWTMRGRDGRGWKILREFEMIKREVTGGFRW